MSVFNNNVNLGVNELWALAYQDFKPYEDRMRSTNVREFRRDTTLDRKPSKFVVSPPGSLDFQSSAMTTSAKET
jgi:hypothetical protein